jgi:NAD/NADP transhydrogenase alpha subunit
MANAKQQSPNTFKPKIKAINIVILGALIPGVPAHLHKPSVPIPMLPVKMLLMAC